MSERTPSIEDLLARARRGDLTADEQRLLERGLQSSLEVKLLYDAGCQFDLESPVLSGDEDLIARLADRVERPRAPARRRRRPPVALLAAACLLVTGAATAGWLAFEMAHESAAPAPSLPPVEAAPPSPPAGGTTPQRFALTSSPEPAPPSPPVTSPVEPAANPAPPRGAPSPVPVGSRPPAPGSARPGIDDSSAAALFRDANRARREGRLATALARYRELRSQFGESAEARDSLLTAAELELRRGAPARALKLFRQYGGGPLAAESVWGQARALRAIGDVPAERAALSRLLRDFPSAPCATAARKRLDETGA